MLTGIFSSPRTPCLAVLSEGYDNLSIKVLWQGQLFRELFFNAIVSLNLSLVMFPFVDCAIIG